MENKLEQLLNSLVEAGWKPRGKDQKFEIWIENLPYKKLRVCLKKPDCDYYVYSYRDLVSVESNLWQFVCENDLINHDNSDHMDYWDKNYTRPDNKSDFCTDTYKYQYRLIETSLKNEDELEQFLLDNIIINEQA